MVDTSEVRYTPAGLDIRTDCLCIHELASDMMHFSAVKDAKVTTFQIPIPWPTKATVYTGGEAITYSR